jgi:hypothetical protein
MNINWHNIRPINGDQKEGFEELISQLARKENIPNKQRFIRKGKQTIIEKHKQISKYFISIPIDPPDARVDGQTSMLEKWDTHVKKWSDWANKEKLNIDFIPWWHSDLIERLQKPENSGFILLKLKLPLRI